MLATLTAYLAHQPPGQTTFYLAGVPGFVALTAGFAIRHAMDVAGARIRGR